MIASQEAGGRPAGNMDATAALRRIVRTNEEIKEVVATAFWIKLMALNAVFLAKKAGRSAVGFSVISNELRDFAQDLTGCMEALRATTFDSAAHVMQAVRQAQTERLLARAEAASDGRLGAALAARSGGARPASAQRSHRLAGLRRTLRRQVDDAVQLVELGTMLTRSARIEAAYGGEFRTALTQVSGEFENIVTRIRDSLDVLRRDSILDASA